MRRRSIAEALTLVSLLAAPAARGDEPKADAPKAVEPKPANGDAPLPEGFPNATKPGRIEVKNYPAYRSAVAKGEGVTMRSGSGMFFTLFNHINSHQIEMTAPVINTFLTPKMVEAPGARGEMTMEFLYASPRQGETGPDGKDVEVVDHPAATYVCLGVQGRMGEDETRAGVAKLRAWLDEHKDEWAAAGPPRQLGYHGPMTAAARRLWEVQIPIEPAKAGPKVAPKGEN